MQPKESKTNKHFMFSVAKSIVRIIAGFALIVHYFELTGFLLIAAESLGIAEEF